MAPLPSVWIAAVLIRTLLFLWGVWALLRFGRRSDYPGMVNATLILFAALAALNGMRTWLLFFPDPTMQTVWELGETTLIGVCIHSMDRESR